MYVRVGRSVTHGNVVEITFHDGIAYGSMPQTLRPSFGGTSGYELYDIPDDMQSAKAFVTQLVNNEFKDGNVVGVALYVGLTLNTQVYISNTTSVKNRELDVGRFFNKNNIYSGNGKTAEKQRPRL